MTYIAYLENWVVDHRDLLQQYGEVSFGHGHQATAKPSAHLLVTLSAEEDVELLLWESGEAEFNRGPFAAPVFEHVQLESPVDLVVLLKRFLDSVTGVVRD